MDRFLVSATSKRTVDSDTSRKIAKKKRANRQYCDSYLELGFTWCGDESKPLPNCLICDEKLSNEGMIPSKLKRHFAKHEDVSDKSKDYFQTLLDGKLQQAEKFKKFCKGSSKYQQASYLVADIIAKNCKPHTDAEKVILPACRAIVRTLFGEEMEKEINKVPLSDNTISRRISDMSTEIEKTVIASVKKTELFSLQVDEYTDISKKAQLSAFIRFVQNDEIKEQFLCCKELEEKTTGKDVFNKISKYLSDNDLSWNQCVGICTDGAPSMVGSIKGFVTIAKKINPKITATHCFIHREVLVTKTLGDELKLVMDQVVKMVNFIKSRPLRSRIFSQLCKNLDANHIALLLHTEVRWLSRGKVLLRVFELRKELLIFFRQENLEEFSNLLSQEHWIAKFAYLVDIFLYLNTLNKSMQGRKENILTSTDKINTFKEKLSFWSNKMQTGCYAMFQRFCSSEKCSEVSPLVIGHLEMLERNVEKYFPDVALTTTDWVRDPFSLAFSNSLSFHEEDELIGIRNDKNLKVLFEKSTLEKFWLAIAKDYPHASKKAIVFYYNFLLHIYAS